ncbi:MAG: 1,2-phenylacetyl-CoA epoxidase subunit PaaD [Woeseiaceae bacterium]
MNPQKLSSGNELVQRVWAWLDEVPDPEIPVVSVIDLGMVREVTVDKDNVVVAVSPTYSGCPATEVIEDSIVSHLQQKGLGSVQIVRTLSPAWSTDWITAAGREKLRSYGIAPPDSAANKRALLGKPVIACPRCRSEVTTLISEFGSTACKASYKCDECLEPFEYFKCI